MAQTQQMELFNLFKNRLRDKSCTLDVQVCASDKRAPLVFEANVTINGAEYDKLLSAEGYTKKEARKQAKINFITKYAVNENGMIMLNRSKTGVICSEAAVNDNAAVKSTSSAGPETIVYEFQTFEDFTLFMQFKDLIGSRVPLSKIHLSYTFSDREKKEQFSLQMLSRENRARFISL